MSSLTKALLASALTLPLVAFAAGVLASPDDVDPDRSRPVIIGKVDDDSSQQPRQERAPDEGRQPDRKDPPPDDDDGPDDDTDGDTDDGRGAPPAGDATDDRPATVVPPAPRDLDDDEDGGDDDNDDNTDDGRESRDD